MVKFQFIFTDQNQNFLIPDNKFNVNVSDVSCERQYFGNNSRPLATVFNDVIESHIQVSESESGETDVKYNFPDFIVFMHGDVSLDVNLLIERIIETNGKYDVIGLAGTKKMNAKASPLNWFTSSNIYPDYRYGDISMDSPRGPMRSFYNKFHHKYVKDTSVACIDGLCIIISKKALEAGLRFDENIAPFDFYDTDISLQTILKYKMKLGVIIIPVFHQSIGISITSAQFKEHEKIFRKKWNM